MFRMIDSTIVTRPKSTKAAGIISPPWRLFTCCVALLFLMMGQQARAQEALSVSGTVIDQEAQLPLPGLTVMVKGTTTGTVTDANGKYSIRVPSTSSTLVFSYIGYATQEILVGNQTQINVTMGQDVSSLDEVVVVGYGTQKKANLTGSVANADMAVVADRPITNLTQGLQGAVPGLNIASNSGTPGQNPSINIRGATSINGGQPLVLVDGTQMNINNINPQDVESVTVLKDAASAAIYGSRAAFGVILITTKKGARNTKPQISYSGNFYSASPTIIPDKVDSYKYALYANSMLTSTNSAKYFNDEHLALIKDRVDGVITNDYTLKANGTSYYEHANTKWEDLMYDDAAVGQNHNLSVSGGTEKTTYRASFAYAKDGGIVKVGNDKYERYNFNTNMSTEVRKWLVAKAQVNFTSAETDLHNLPGGNFGPSIFHVIWRARPTWTPYYDVDGVPYQTFSRLNPLATIEKGGRDLDKTYNLNTKAGVEMTFEDFQVFSNYTFNPIFREGQRNHKQFYSIQPWNNLTVSPESEASYIERTHNNSYYYAFDIYGKYAKTFAEVHQVQATLGFNQENMISTYERGYNTLLISDDVPSLSNTLGTPLVSDDHDEWALRSVFARVNYNYKEKYLLEFNGRYDGSSRFAKDSRYGFFPSVSAGWKVSDEAFLKDATWINLLKVRGSYGDLGNQNSAFLYPFVGYNTTLQTNWITNGTRPIGLSPQNPISASRTWETVSSVNFGADMMFFKGRMDLTFDVYRRDTKGMLVPGQALPGIFGAPAPQANAADLRVNGWETAIGWMDEFSSGLRYNVNLVLADSKGEITKYDNPNNSLAVAYYTGKTIGEIWGFETVGLFQSQEEINDAPNHGTLSGGNLIRPGDVRYADLNGDGVINNGKNTLEDPGDRRVIGNASPRYTYGIRGGVGYKGFDLSVFFQGVAKRDFWIDGPIMFGGDGGIGNMIVTNYLYDNVWSDGSDGLPVNTDAYYFRPSQTSVVDRNTLVQTRYLQDASYLRLKNLTVGYTFSNELLSKINLTSARVFVSGENLVTFTKLNPNFDPEVLDPGQDNLGGTSFSNGGGQSGKLYPLSKRVSFGVSVGF
ncbi:TonB-dependent receptor [Algoriphagus sp. H41]|uniref:TonB-dependent receptor n=1 Tax=Algoriphagus oliviformis TaxID=2811231 RepID=A0ABS3BYL9_9BACT|nr:TonB-dependent receptor [Algoriphagus oliviformis]MBN7809952.1 TonB-dependent receptor [Algoriphagus oliviformis]